MAVVLIGGGARSGKSRYALLLARQRGKRLAFVATAQARDEEMERRIEAHQRERGGDFTTIEEPYDVAATLQTDQYDCIVVDCLTLWLSNVLLSLDRDAAGEIVTFVAAAAASPAQLILVTNEVGCGIVPDNLLSRRFRDLAGNLNQRLAEIAAEVYWMVFGQPLRVK